jgi:hypothetical protein
LAEPHFPLWAFIAYVTGIPIGMIFVWLLACRLREAHPETWENLGRPSGSPFSSWVVDPGQLPRALKAWMSNFRLLYFPFRTESFQMTDRTTVALLWILRTILALLVILGIWSIVV